MLLRAYSVYDNKALQYHAPFFAVTDGSALRSFQEMANDLNTTIGRHPSDYSLFWVGTYDDQKGHFNPNLPLTHVADASALLNQQSRVPMESSPLNIPTLKSKKS